MFLELEPHKVAKLNAQIVLQNAILYPFRLRRQALLCVFCEESHEDPIQFRRHIDLEHKKFSVFTAFAHIAKSKDFLKVDCTNLKCRLCSKPFSKVKDVAEHLVKEHTLKIKLNFEIALQTYKLERDRWICIYCNERLPTITDLCRHTTTSHYQKYTCDECGRTYMTDNSLRHHKKCSHSGGFTCPRCWQNFPTLEARKEHQSKTMKCMAYGCIYCTERFLSWKAKNKHLVEKHNKPNVIYKCSECTKSFKNRRSYNTHYQKIHISSGFKCTCGIKCWSQNQLDQHKASCKGFESHKCSVCDKVFAKKHNLAQHMWIHSHTKRYECKLCNKTFNQKVSYRTHMKVHHPDKDLDV